MTSIERCKELIKPEHSNWIGISNQKAIENVLNTMFKAIEESAYYKDLLKLERKEREQTKKSLKGQIKKKDKIINKMAEQLAGLAIWNNHTEEPLILGSKEEVIEHYERQVEENE